MSARLIGVLVLALAGCTDTVNLVDSARGSQPGGDGSVDASDAESDDVESGDADAFDDDGAEPDSGQTYGSSCMGTCEGGLACLTTVGGPGDTQHGLPDGLCTKSCQRASDCPSPDTACATLHGAMLCIPTCDLSSGIGCRPGYGCCANSQMVNGPGVCAPHWSVLCRINGD